MTIELTTRHLLLLLQAAYKQGATDGLQDNTAGRADHIAQQILLKELWTDDFKPQQQ